MSDITATAIVTAALYIGGWLSIIHAINYSRTPQGTVAWCIALISFPPVALPAYWLVGRTRFYGYREAIRDALQQHQGYAESARVAFEPYIVGDEKLPPSLRVYDALTTYRFTHSNKLDLLIDGEATFDAIFDAIENAEEYVLVQFFTLVDDDLGQQLKNRLIAQAQQGRRVYLLYDSIGSYALSRRYVRELREAGVRVAAFRTGRAVINPFRINFRNHRKIVVVDGKVAFVGGLNVSDIYMGKNPHFGHWRDTHVRVKGPAVQIIQGVFSADWYWATSEFLQNNNIEPTPVRGKKSSAVLPLPTGPVDDHSACSLFFVNAIHRAKKRIWIASPYFIPDESIRSALELAVLRGVDVRILLPDRQDHLVVYLAMFAFVQLMQDSDVPIYRYENGFLHQKALIADDLMAAVGTANLDNRSFGLNFEITLISTDPEFVSDVDAMFTEDFANSKLAALDELSSRGFHVRIAARIARLFAPIL